MLNASIVNGNFPGGPGYTWKDAPAVESTDPAALLTPKGPVKLENFICLPGTGKVIGNGSNKKTRQETHW